MASSPILVTGFRRSGTSMVIKALEDLGVWIGGNRHEFRYSGEKNPEGFYEHEGFKDVSLSVLKANELDWDSIFPVNDLQVDTDEFKSSIGNIVWDMMDGAKIYKAKYWAFKAPVHTLLLSHWMDVFPEMKIIWCLRNPIESAYSLLQSKTQLKKYNKDTMDYAVQLWTFYSEILISEYVRKPNMFLITHYPDWINITEEEIKRVDSFLNFHYPDGACNTNRAIAGIQPQLWRHKAHEVLHKITVDPQILAKATELYTLALDFTSTHRL